MDLLAAFFSHWYSALAVILVLGGLIFFHELGHFLAARAMGIGVVTFSLGMGKKLLTITRGRTEYCLSLIPFGGYVSTVGEYSPEVEERGFTQEEAVFNRPPWQRMVLAFAGPFANILLAFIIYWGIAAYAGISTPLPQIGMVMPDSPAAVAGLEKGDMIIGIDGIVMDSWSDIPEAVGQFGGKQLSVVVERAGKQLNFSLSPTRSVRTNIFGEQEEAWLLGVQAGGAVRTEPVSFINSAGEGLRQTWFMIDLTLTGLWKLVTGSVASDSVGGPILIAQMVGQQAEVGILPLLMLAALISVNLGLLNLLPVPVLDGGLIVFCLIEMIIRRPIPDVVQERSMQVGAFLLIGLMVFATFNDLRRLIFG